MRIIKQFRDFACNLNPLILVMFSFDILKSGWL